MGEKTEREKHSGCVQRGICCRVKKQKKRKEKEFFSNLAADTATVFSNDPIAV